MRFGTMMVSAAALAIAGCGGGDGHDETNLAAADGNAVGNVADPAANASAGASATASNGRQYVELAGAGDLYEIESARLAQEKATRTEIRELAGMILADHQRSTTELTTAAGQAQPPITATPAMNAEQQANIQALQAASGEAFDREYLAQQVRAHEQALSLVTSYAASGDVESLRQHAATVADPIQRHLSRARELQVPAPE